ncbi:MAG: hypothetical protein IJP91_06960 [Synergistaceae bacterium]|nr:hypothetical protein [Synergistaceae bacterium]
MRKGILAAALCLCATLLSVPAFAGKVGTSDYYEKIEYEEYDLVGSWTLDFELTDAMKDAIIAAWNPAWGTLTRDKVVSFSSVALKDDGGAYVNWNNKVTVVEWTTLAKWGVHAATTLPVATGGTTDNVYVARCNLGADVNENERLTAWGYSVSTETLRHDRYGDAGSTSNSMFFAEVGGTFQRVTTVPASKQVYVVISLFRPANINTGIVTVGRGTYHAEDDPVDRLPPEFTQLIADELNIDIDEIKYLSSLQLSYPATPTEDIRKYVSGDNHQITLNLPTTLASEEAEDKLEWYAISVDLSEPLWANTFGKVWKDLDGQAVSNYKIYAFGEDFIAEERFQPAFITGLVNTFELFSLTGKKLEKFGVREFLMVGLLNAGKPFSFYLGKLLIALLMGGCNTGAIPGAVSAAVLGFIILRARRRR